MVQSQNERAIKFMDLLVILSLQEIKFFFNPVARFANGEFERLTRLGRPL